VASTNAVIPVSNSRISRDGLPNFQTAVPDSSVSIISCSVRVGSENKPIGMVQSLTYQLIREVEEYYEIMAYPSPQFGSIDAIFSETSFNDSTAYDGEVATLFPGVIKPVIVTLRRPFLYSNNAIEALFKRSGAGEFATKPMDDIRYSSLVSKSFGEANSGLGNTLKNVALGAVSGAALGAIKTRPGSPGKSPQDAAIEGAVGGALQALLPTEDYNPERTRYVSLLQQVRPLDITFMIMSPTERKSSVYGIQFKNGWATDWKINNIDAAGDGILMEDVTMTFERVRMQKDL
jgi:hypothetical protein